MQEFVNHLEISDGTFYYYLNKNKLTVEQIYDRFTCNVEVDGLKFNSLDKLSNYLGVNKRALTHKRGQNISWDVIVREEKELSRLSKLTGISRVDLVDRLSEGKSLEELERLHCIYCKYNNKIFYNLKTLAEELRTPLNILVRYINEGMKLEDILYLYSSVEYKGKTYINHRELVEKLGELSYESYLKKLRAGYSIEDSLTNKSNTRINTHVLNVKIRRIFRAHKLNYCMERYFNEEYILNKLLWKNYNFLGFTENNLVVYRKLDDDKIICTSFEEYISYLERENNEKETNRPSRE